MTALFDVLCGVLVAVSFGVASAKGGCRVSSLVSALWPALTLTPSSFAPGLSRLRPGVDPLSPRGRARPPLSPARIAVAVPKEWSPVGPGRRRAIRPEEVFLLSQMLTDRDWEILKTVNMLRLVTATQIERLHFWELKETSRPVVRRRVLKRLSNAGAIIALPRRVGGKQFGSEQQMFALDVAGAQLLHEHFNWKDDVNPRSISVPGALFHRHRLAASELYVRLKEMSRSADRGFVIAKFETEPECWWPYARADERTSRNRHARPQGFLKPDAYLLGCGKSADRYGSFWIEIDLATESTERVWRKVGLYAEFNDDRSAEKPERLMPHILITTPTQRRRDQIRKALDTWDWGYQRLSEVISVRIECFEDAVSAIIEDLPGT
jgi:hypothetical protein